MPELPEIENICREINELLYNYSPQSFVVREGLANKSKVSALDVMDNYSFDSAKRIGKYLILTFSSIEKSCPNYYVVFHAGMNAAFDISNKSDPSSWMTIKFNGKNDKVNSQSCLNFTGIRFSKVYLFNSPFEEKRNLSWFSSYFQLGIDVIINSQSSLAYFLKASQKRRVNIKTFLMDQRNIAGIGNYLANEILFEMKINPNIGIVKTFEILRKIYPIPEEFFAATIINTVKRFINLKGSSFSTHKGVNGVKGEGSKHFRVYQQEHCTKCSSLILNCIIGNRGTYYCPQCQKSS